MVEIRIDFYGALRSLINQIPEGMVTTPIALAEALGDKSASLAVSEALERPGLRELASKIVKSPSQNTDVFCEFSTDQPLRKLAELQEKLSKRVVHEDMFKFAELLAGVDAAYRGDEAYAVCVVLDSRLLLVESKSAAVEVRFPYIPGYLSFREAPVIEAAAHLVSGFDVLLVNGHGLAHPRGCGLATQVGLDLDVPTLGVAKRVLVGELGNERNGWTPIIYRGNVVGGRLKDGAGTPVYVSVGNKISLETSIDIVKRTMRSGRLPEPLMRAHQAAGELSRLVGGSSP